MLYREAPLEAKVRRLVASLALESSVRLAGCEPPARVAQWLSAADLFVSGSRREGSGFALLEAMACGVCPVVTDIPAFRALTRDGSVGHLWQSGEPETLASALESAWRLRPSREAVRAHFTGHLSFERIGALAAAAYRSSVQARAAARSAGRPA
jgi:glycosyltransferase involved in cell wall biosynthesis